MYNNLLLKAKEAVKDTKKGITALSKKTEDMDIKDVPDRLIPSAEKVDRKLAEIQHDVESARHADVHGKNVEKYPVDAFICVYYLFYITHLL